MLIRLLPDISSWEVHLGLTDAENEGDFIWYPTNEAATWIPWSEGDPNNGLDTGEEDCISILAFTADFKWSDVPCDIVVPGQEVKILCEHTPL